MLARLRLCWRLRGSDAPLLLLIRALAFLGYCSVRAVRFLLWDLAGAASAASSRFPEAFWRMLALRSVPASHFWTSICRLTLQVAAHQRMHFLKKDLRSRHLRPGSHASLHLWLGLAGATHHGACLCHPALDTSTIVQQCIMQLIQIVKHILVS